METMKAFVINEDGTYSVREVPIPEINDYEVLVKMKANSLCGTDQKYMHGKFQQDLVFFPFIPGHEGVGEVVKLGSKVTGLKLGDVVIAPYTHTKCGDVNYGWGTMAEYSVAGDYEAIKRDNVDIPFTTGNCMPQRVIPKDMDPVAATMIITFREVYLASKRMQWKKGENIVIYGCGPVGLCFVKMAKLLGLSPIISVDLFDDKLENAKEQGADYVINSGKSDIAEEVKKILPNGADIILDAAGVISLVNKNISMIRDLGRVYVYGTTVEHSYNLDWTNAPYNFSLSFIQMPNKDEELAAHPQIMEWIKDGTLEPMDYISDVFDFEHVTDAIDMFFAKKNKKKISIRF